MKTRLHTAWLAGIILALALPAGAQQKVSDRASLSAAALAPATDILPIVDISAGTAGSKKITIDALFEGWGFTAAGETMAQAADAAAQRTALGMVGNIYSLSHGTAAGNLVRLDPSTGKLPAVDGSLLTNLPGGGLTNWTDAVSTTTPNGSVSAASLTATGGATNIDAVIAPKGTGAVLAQVPDGSSPAGNKRGARAVDFQRVRSSAGQVAAGADSFLGGGNNNTITGNYSVVGGGYSNSAGGQDAVIGGGESNSTTQNYAFVGGGNVNSATGASAAICGGTSNAASGLNSSIEGGYANTASGAYSSASGVHATTRSLHGAEARSAGRFAAMGDAQAGRYILRRATTDATQTELTLDGDVPASSTRLVLPNNSSYSFTGQLAARSSTGDAAAWRFSGTIERGAAAANTAIIGTVTLTDTHAEAGASAWAVAIDADTTNGSLRLRVTGVAATSIRWVAVVDTCELTY